MAGIPSEARQLGRAIGDAGGKAGEGAHCKGAHAVVSEFRQSYIWMAKIENHMPKAVAGPEIERLIQLLAGCRG